MYTKREIQRGNRRLLQLAKELEAVPKAKYVKKIKEFRGYDQNIVLHPCGAPACAWGHYVVNNVRRRKRILAESGGGGTFTEEVQTGNGEIQTLRLPAIWGPAQREFAISDEQADELFEAGGCGYAQTGKQAAKYIRQFVANRQKGVQ